MSVWKAISIGSLAVVATAGCSFLSEDYEEISKRWSQKRQAAAQLEQTGDYARAEVDYAEAIKLAEAMKLNLSPLVISLEDLARVKYLERDMDQAEKLYQRAYKVCLERGATKESAMKAFTREENLRALQGLGNINRDRGKNEEAEKYYKQVVGHVEDVSESFRSSFLADYAEFLEKVGRQDEALKMREDAQEMNRLFEHHTSAGFQREKNTSWGRALDQAEWLTQGERFGDAADEFSRALDEASVTAPQTAQMAETVDVIYKLKWPAADRATCSRLWKKALALEVKGGETEQYGEHMGLYAGTLLSWGDKKEAREYGLKALKILEAVHDRSHLPGVLETVAFTTEDKEERLKLLDRAYAIVVQDKRTEATMRLAKPLSDIYEQAGRYEEASKTYMQCFSVTADRTEPTDRSIAALREQYQKFKERRATAQK